MPILLLSALAASGYLAKSRNDTVLGKIMNFIPPRNNPVIIPEDAFYPSDVIEEEEDFEEMSGTLTTFHWNVHWQCGVMAWGGSQSCNSQALGTAEQLAKSKGADVIALIEVQNAHIFGYAKGCESPDYVSLFFKEGWTIENVACGTMNAGMHQGSRGLSVALVTPPNTMGPCTQICFAAVHAPHYAIVTGIDYIRQGCGNVQSECMVAMGDWNAAGGEAYAQFKRLVGYDADLVEPNVATCCDQASCTTCQFDHTITNIPGATLVTDFVWDYIHLAKVDEEHKPVSVTLSF